MTRASNKPLKTFALVACSFSALCSAVIALMIVGVVSFQMGLLMLVALVGLYVGFGVLALVYRVISKLE